MTPSAWVQEKEAAKLLGLAKATLQRFRRSGELLPGEHWLYVTGKSQSPVQYNVEAIREHQRALTIAAVKAENERLAKLRSKIETYNEAHLEELIAEVQS